MTNDFSAFLLPLVYFSLQGNHRIIELFGLEGTFEDHLVQPSQEICRI